MSDEPEKPSHEQIEEACYNLFLSYIENKPNALEADLRRLFEIVLDIRLPAQDRLRLVSEIVKI
jgi:hypothetical protein